MLVMVTGGPRWFIVKHCVEYLCIPKRFLDLCDPAFMCIVVVLGMASDLLEITFEDLFTFMCVGVFLACMSV